MHPAPRTSKTYNARQTKASIRPIAKKRQLGPSQSCKSLKSDVENADCTRFATKQMSQIGQKKQPLSLCLSPGFSVKTVTYGRIVVVCNNRVKFVAIQWLRARIFGLYWFFFTRVSRNQSYTCKTQETFIQTCLV